MLGQGERVWERRGTGDLSHCRMYILSNPSTTPLSLVPARPRSSLLPVFISLHNGCSSSSSSRPDCEPPNVNARMSHMLTMSKATGTTRGYIFSSKRSRRLPVIFKTIAPVAETFENPRYVRIEEKFSQPTAGREIHDCKVVVGGNIFLITAYWEEDDHKNRAVGSAGKGLIWRGEVAVVQVGRLKPFYKRPKNPSSVNKAVARFVPLLWTRMLFLLIYFLPDS